MVYTKRYHSLVEPVTIEFDMQYRGFVCVRERKAHE